MGESLRYIFSGLIPPEKIYVVPNGIDPLKFKVATLEKRTNGKVRICFLSNLHRTKGFGEVLQAIRILSEKYRIDCTFAGKWINKTDEIETLKYIEKHSLKNIAKFVGTVKGKGKIDLLANSDIFVLPTYFKNEGQPWAILEAMATGLPVISTDHGCIAETVCDSETGFIVPKRDIYALVMKIEILITMNNLRIQMGKKGRLRLASMFTEDKFIHRLNVVFSELL
ncbi:MAG: glycosyltransferase [bacterium]